jgi:hypothetical protein
VEIMAAANESRTAGRHISIRSTFKWPVIVGDAGI